MSHRSLPNLALWTLLLHLWASPVSAQVNTETQRIGDDVEEGFHGDMKGDLSLKRGNVDLFQVGASARAFYQTGIHTPLLFGRAEYGEQDRESYTESIFGHARWTAMWHERVGSELFGQLQYDNNVRMKFRSLVGAGVRVGLVQAPWIECYVGTGYMLENEVLNLHDWEAAPHPRVTLFHRSTSYLSLTAALDDNLKFSSVTYLQPRFADLEDTRLLEEAELSVKVNALFSIVNTFILRVDTKPPPTVKKTDAALTVGVRLSY